jgi:hypothetical protein
MKYLTEEQVTNFIELPARERLEIIMALVLSQAIYSPIVESNLIAAKPN